MCKPQQVGLCSHSKWASAHDRPPDCSVRPHGSGTSLCVCAAQVAGLRASRDKLLLELDEQAAEAQRLALENGVLQQARMPATQAFV